MEMLAKSWVTDLPKALLLLLLPAVVTAMQLPPEIQADRYLLQAERAIDEQDFVGAKTAMDGILELQAQHDLEIPEQFSFRYAEVLGRLGLYDEAIEWVTQYLTLTGRDGEFYREALELLDSTEETSRRAQLERELAEAARRQAEAEKREIDELVQRQIEEAGIPLPPDALRSGGTAPEMVRIARGRFQYLTFKYDEPFGPYHHWVELDRPFAISRYEVTRGEFERFVENSDYRPGTNRDGECYGPSDSKYGGGDISVKWNSQRYQYNGRSDGRHWGEYEELRPTDAHPVFCVSLRDAMAYAEWLSQQTGQTYRLPSAAEWQYAARAGSTEAVSAEYSDAEDRCGLGNMAWNTCTDGVKRIAPVGRFSPNGIGLHDMFGNVSEWVLACPHSNDRRSDGAPEHVDSCDRIRSGLETYVALGDNWKSPAHIQAPIYPAENLHFTYVGRSGGSDDIGIRVVRDLASQETSR